MANHKSANKRNRQNEVRKTRNRGVRSAMRKAIKEAREAIANKADDQADRVKAAISHVNRARSRNILKSNTASRYVSRLMRAANG